MKKTLPFLVSLSAILFFGAGCASAPSEPVGKPNTELEQTLGTQPETPQSLSIPSVITLDSFTAIPTSFPGVLRDADRLGRSATIKTTKGNIVVELYGDA
ncbi:MAG: hypothetical protein AAB886_02895, partial [Patescibacteria group bacterium]